MYAQELTTCQKWLKSCHGKVLFYIKTIMNNPKYVKFKDQEGKFRFNLRAENGEIILHSESYVTENGCDGGINSVRINSPYDSQYKRNIALNGQYYFVLHAVNSQVIGTSETYTTIAARENGIKAVQRVGLTAPVDDQTKSY